MKTSPTKEHPSQDLIRNPLTVDQFHVIGGIPVTTQPVRESTAEVDVLRLVRLFVNKFTSSIEGNQLIPENTFCDTSLGGPRFLDIVLHTLTVVPEVWSFDELVHGFNQVVRASIPLRPRG